LPGVTPTPADSPAGYPPGADPDRIGPYRLLQILGMGGMGVVYEAEQVEPVTRRVALKLLLPGTPDVFLARFDAERQALAVMDHPHIARVFDAGTAPDGRPYYVMERVAGVPITDFCDQHQLTTEARLRLFVDVCNAVHHAHQKGIIHRDLKPSNVLVTTQDDEPVPKIIDFGIAKALGARLTDLTLHTMAGGPLGTPAYMSPEQWDSGQVDVDTRADIYSLGVMLYELLTGQLPFDPMALMRAGVGAAVVLRRTPPEPPSIRYNSLGGDGDPVAAARRTDPRALVRQLRGDLDWITLKAIDPDRSRRYDSASALGDDIERFLRSEPIQARPPTAAYQLSRFARRHRVAVGLAAALLVAGVGVATLTTVQARQVARERDRAQAEAAKVRELNTFLQTTLLSPDPVQGLGRDVTMIQVIDSAVARMRRRPPESKPVEAAVKSAIGWAYYSLGQYDRAEPLLAEALRIRTSLEEPDSAELGESYFRIAALHQALARDDSAEAAYRTALAIRRNVTDPARAELASTLAGFGNFLGLQGDTAEAHADLEEARRLFVSEGDSSGIAAVENSLGILAHARGDLAAAERHFSTTIEIRRRIGDKALGDALGNLGVVYDDLKRTEDAERNYREAIADLESKFGPEHELVTATWNNLAILLDRTGRAAQAESIYRRILDIDTRKFGPDHPNVGRTLTNLSLLRCTHGDPASGLPMIQRALRIARRDEPPGGWYVAATESAEGVCLAAAKRYPEAEQAFVQAIDALKKALGPTHWRVDTTRARLKRMYVAWGKPERAAAIDSTR
jgi:serine/threonine protein kinase/tetratricopeptide (TPR) repeat protein